MLSQRSLDVHVDPPGDKLQLVFWRQWKYINWATPPQQAVPIHYHTVQLFVRQPILDLEGPSCIISSSKLRDLRPIRHCGSYCLGFHKISRSARVLSAIPALQHSAQKLAAQCQNYVHTLTTTNIFALTGRIYRSQRLPQRNRVEPLVFNQHGV